jgi:hypothetical protein
MKVLAIQQPWAQLICAGIKDVENRSWKTPYRGKFLVMASSAKVTKNFLDKMPIEIADAISNQEILGNIPVLSELPTSAIIGYVELDDITEEDNGSIWGGGPFWWILKNARLFDEPILNVKGKLHLFEIPEIDENELPASHQIILKSPEMKGKKAVIPVCEDAFDQSIEDKSIKLWVHDDTILPLIDEKDGTETIKDFDEVDLVSPSRRQTFKVDKVEFATPLDEKGEPFMAPSLWQEDMIPIEYLNICFL